MESMNSTLASSYDPALVLRLKQDIVDEIFKAAKFSQCRIFRRVISPVFEKPARRFSQLFASLDLLVRDFGIVFAARQGLGWFSDQACAIGREFIPLNGPLIIASNHPGTYDSFAIISQMPRNDVKVIVSGIPFLKDLPNLGDHLIYSTLDTSVRMDVIRKSVKHLEMGGALLIFPSGRIDPDPSVLPGACDSFNDWSASLEIFMRKIPASRLVLAVTSGVLSSEFVHHPFPRLFKKGHERRRVMEFMQVIRQMIRRKPLALQPKISFDQPLDYVSINLDGRKRASESIKNKALRLLEEHLALFYPKQD